jgi:SAM-dependent methyltransferase
MLLNFCTDSCESSPPNNILHLFSGSLDDSIPGIKLDIKGKNGVIEKDAEKLSGAFSEGRFDLILADPPYSNEDALHYGTPMINRNKVVSECYKILKPGGFLVWLDQVFPMFRKTEFKLVGTIGIIRSTNHRVRCVFIFQKTMKVESIDEWLK